MTVKEMLGMLQAFPPQAKVLVSVGPLVLRPPAKLHGYGINDGSNPIVVIVANTTNAPKGED